MAILQYGFYALGLLFLYKLAGYVYVKIGDWRFAREHDCQPPVKEPQRERIIGVEPVLRITKAAKEGKILEFATNRYDSYGATFSQYGLGRTMLHTVDPENVKAILATQFKDYDLGTREADFGQLLGKGIFVSNGERWEHSRALVRPSFTRSQVADLDSFEAHVQTMFSRIPENVTFDLQPLLFRLTLDSSTEFLFGESVNSQTSPENSYQQQFAIAFDTAQQYTAKRLRLGPYLKNFFYNKELKENCDFVHEFVDKFVHRALAYRRDIESGRINEKDEDGGRYVFLHEAAKATNDAFQLRSEILNILLAGRDTTASLLANTLHTLVRRPDIWAKLQREVDGLEGKIPTYEEVKNLKYIRHLLNESLRLFPVVPGNARFANKRTTLPRGGGPDGNGKLFVPKGMPVSYMVWAMHRRKDLYGPDADEFNPDRWDTLRVGWNYLPFNGGPRICVGQQFALMEASYFMIRFVQEWEFPENRDPGPWVENLALTVVSNNGVKVGMKRRAK